VQASLRAKRLTAKVGAARIAGNKPDKTPRLTEVSSVPPKSVGGRTRSKPIKAAKIAPMALPSAKPSNAPAVVISAASSPQQPEFAWVLP
jgi:hypothetical protein